MNLTNQLHPDSLFKYVNLRQARAANPDSGSTVGITIYSAITAASALRAKTTDNSLYPKLMALKGSENVVDGIVNEVNQFKKSEHYSRSADALQMVFPEVIKLVDYLDGYGNAITARGIIAKFKSWAGSGVEAYAAGDAYRNKKIMVWDNILACLISPTELMPLTLLCKMIGALNVIDLINESSEKHGKNIELSSEQVYDAYHVQALVPEWIIIAMMSKPNTADNAVNMVDYKAPDKTAELTKRIVLSAATRNELKKIYEGKLHALTLQQAAKNKDISNILAQSLKREKQQEKLQATAIRHSQLFADPDILTKSDLIRLAPDVKNHLLQQYSTLEEINISALVNNEASLTQELMIQLGMTVYTPEIYLANALLGNDDTKCQYYDRNPYCDDGRQATKPFVSHGSFVNAMIIGDLLVTKQQLIKYNTGEVAHIENILAGESKTRSHRTLDRTEITTTHESETENETLHDLTSTERFAMEKETTKVLSTDFNINAGTNFSASYGTMTISGYLNGGYSSSSEESNKQASKFSKDVTERTLQRVKTIVREMQTVHILKETEETNVHELKNPIEPGSTFGITPHINGVYKWVDKYYLNRIVNYGRRLMLEFQIPEPANFYLFREIQNKLKHDAVAKPIAPEDLLIVVERDYKIGLTSASVLTDYNYTFWASHYGATDVEAPPALYANFSSSFSSAAMSGGNDGEVLKKDIPVPDKNYQVNAVRYYGLGEYDNGFRCFRGMISDNYCDFNGWGIVTFTNTLQEVTQVALSLEAYCQAFVLNLKLICVRTEAAYNTWKLATYEKILNAYEKKLAEYNDWLSSQNASNILIEGDNPDINRQTERIELKKRCIEMFSGQRFEANDAAVDGIHNLSGYPEMLFNEAIREGNIAKFFEHAFEWENMSYIFYDYFYARKSKWLTLTNLDDKADPLFKKFLQAGNARVNVPVRPGYEKLVMIFHSLSNWISSVGCGWNFNPQLFGQLNLSTEFSPGIENGTYMSIAEELQAANGLNDYGTFNTVTDPVTGNTTTTTNIIDAYIQKVPTNLVYLANGAGPYPELPDYTNGPEMNAEIVQVMQYFDLL